EFSVYPNPSNGVFRLNIEEEVGNTPYQVQIVDLIGKELLNQSVKAQEVTTFDLSNAPKGVYFIKITQGREQIIKRVVIR
ncbi:MAG: T9SS type A sorting domain-containing protein, partial [Bacteroidota bacterium]